MLEYLKNNHNEFREKLGATQFNDDNIYVTLFYISVGFLPTIMVLLCHLQCFYLNI